MTGSRLTAGLRTLFGSTAGAAQELTGADRTLRTALPLSRRIGVVALGGGSGSTAVATALASMFASRRPGPVLAVDAAGGHAGLVRQTVAADPQVRTAVAAAAEQRRTARTAAHARAGLPQSGAGLCVLDLAGPHRRPVSVAEWTYDVSPIARFFDLVVTDWGVRPPAMDLTESAATSHVLVVVSRADRHAATTAASAVATLEGGGSPLAAILVLVDVSRTADRVAPAVRRRLGAEVRVLPFETEWAEDRSASSRRFSARTRRAHIQLAVTVMAAAVRSQQPTARPTPATHPNRSLLTPEKLHP